MEKREETDNGMSVLNEWPNELINGILEPKHWRRFGSNIEKRKANYTYIT